MQGMDKEDLPAQIDYATKVVNLNEDLDKHVSDYSGGMKRRLSLAIALVADPEILILDEPTVGIDPELRKQIWQELHRLSQAGKTILLTTHVMEDAEEVFLKAGRQQDAHQVGVPTNGSMTLPQPPQQQAKNYSVNTHYIYGDKDTSFFDTFLPVMMGFVVFFFVFIISGIALLRERTTGTLKRLLATPVKRGEIITGYLSGYGILALIQTLIIVLYSTYVFKIQILGSIWNVLLINVLMAFVALTMGLFISTFAASEFQMVQFIPIVVIPQVFFSGIIPVDQMAGWLQAIGHVMPLYYGANAMSDVVAKGFGLSKIWPNLLALLCFAGLFLVLNLVTMRRYREV